MPEITIQIDQTGAIDSAVEAAAQMYLRLNQHRGNTGDQRVVPIKLTLECAVVHLTDRQRLLLKDAQVTGYCDGPPFQSPEEVFQFFRREMLDLMWGNVTILEQYGDKDLEDMAEAVILSRRHCEF